MAKQDWNTAQEFTFGSLRVRAVPVKGDVFRVEVEGPPGKFWVEEKFDFRMLGARPLQAAAQVIMTLFIVATDPDESGPRSTREWFRWERGTKVGETAWKAYRAAVGDFGLPAIEDANWKAVAAESAWARGSRMPDAVSETRKSDRLVKGIQEAFEERERRRHP